MKKFYGKLLVKIAQPSLLWISSVDSRKSDSEYFCKFLHSIKPTWVGILHILQARDFSPKISCMSNWALCLTHHTVCRWGFFYLRRWKSSSKEAKCLKSVLGQLTLIVTIPGNRTCLILRVFGCKNRQRFGWMLKYLDTDVKGKRNFMSC